MASSGTRNAAELSLTKLTERPLMAFKVGPGRIRAGLPVYTSKLSSSALWRAATRDLWFSQSWAAKLEFKLWGLLRDVSRVNIVSDLGGYWNLHTHPGKD